MMKADLDMSLHCVLVGLVALGASACIADDRPAADAGPGGNADARPPVADARPPLADAPVGTPADAAPPDGLPPPGTPFSVEGQVTGSAVPPNAKAVIAWVFLGGDAAVKYGEGTSTGDRFVARMAANPPAEAVRLDGLALGAVLLVPSTAVVPDGNVDLESLELLGYSRRQLVVWKNPAGSGTRWSAPFPAGYSCGGCTPAAPRDLVPVDCAQVRIDAPASDDGACEL